MVREERGPYGDPQHAYFYEEDDVWMAPGFINQFYEVGHLSYQSFFEFSCLDHPRGLRDLSFFLGRYLSIGRLT